MTFWKRNNKIQKIERGSMDDRMAPSAMKEFPRPSIKPHDLIGRIVQISLDKYELGGPHMLIPPLRVVSCAEGEYNKTDMPRIVFLGTPLGPFKGTEHREARFASIRAIEFHSASPVLPPHYLLDKAFASFCGNIGYSPPVLVFGSTLDSAKISSSMLVSGKDFFYVGYGMLQVFREDFGFDMPWPEPDQWLEDLRKNEARLLAHGVNGDKATKGGGVSKESSGLESPDHCN
jgi:hypothetical protein